MEPDTTVPAAVTGEEQLRRRARAFVRERPLVCVAAAAAVGAALGGVFFSRLGRLAFTMAAGYVANEILHHEGRLGIASLLERTAPAGERGTATRGTVPR